MSRSILIVDDHDGFRAWARVVLEAGGYTVVGESVDGASSVADVRRLRPEVLLLDIQLPDFDGFQVTEAVLREPDPPRIVLISSREASDYGGRLRASGADGFITKAELSRSAIERVLDQA